MKNSITLATLLLLLLGNISAQNWIEMASLTSGDSDYNDEYGVCVSIDGDYAIVGAELDTENGTFSGSAYIYKKDFGGAGNWGQIKKLTDPLGNNYDNFGRSVSISGDYAIVGALEYDYFSTNIGTGSAYIFYKNQGGADNWGFVKTITASDGAIGDRFGWSVDINGTFVIVGAYYDDDLGTDSGAAYIFQKDEDGLNNWGEVQKITAINGADFDWFGYSVSISSDHAIVGARYEENNSITNPDVGAAYIFRKDQGGNDNWGQVRILKASDGLSGDQFGFNVSIDNEYAIVTAVGDDNIDSSLGSAYIFYKNQGGINNWGQTNKLIANDNAPGANYGFGWNASLDGNHVIIGAVLDAENGSQSGAAYLYSKDQGGADNWGEVQKITSSNISTNDWFGYCVDINEDNIIAGAFTDYSSGSAHIFSVEEPNNACPVPDISSLVVDNCSFPVVVSWEPLAGTVNYQFHGENNNGNVQLNRTVTSPGFNVPSSVPNGFMAHIQLRAQCQNNVWSDWTPLTPYVINCNNSSIPFPPLDIGVSMDQLTPGISLFPNPVYHTLNLQYSNSGTSTSFLEIIDLLGNTIYQQEFGVGEKGQIIAIDLHELTPGTYFVNLHIDEQLINKKFVKL